jgi:hypothetical protein
VLVIITITNHSIVITSRRTVEQDIRDLGSMVIGFLVLTLLEQPEYLSKIKKALFLEHPVTMCITVLHLERVYDVRCTLCGRAKRSAT